MGVQQKLSAFLFQLSMFLLVSASQGHKKAKGRHSSKKDHNIKMSSRLQFEITLHGFLLWASMAFLMPIGMVY
uniref:Uncharacterized protein n=1 Tax=Glycine max TaxID=3847 RepID=C6SXQ0_SOYBN|nr:unknown [Glycine max]